MRIWRGYKPPPLINATPALVGCELAMAGPLGGSRRHQSSWATLAIHAIGLLPDLHPIADHVEWLP
jgi:hypothetical protein